MTLVITGATGHLGRLVVSDLLARGVPGAELVATGRQVDRLADLSDQGVRVARADFEDPRSLASAFDGAARVLLVSGSEVGRRITQHQNVIEAARQAGVGLLAYTSILHADTSSLALAVEHRATEEAIAASGVPHALLRNSWYLENYTAQLGQYLAHGIVGAAGDGLLSAATRADYAAAAATVLLAEAPEVTYELGGTPFTMADLAAEVSRVSGQDVGYTNLDVPGYTALLVRAGLPEPVAAVYADADRGIAAGDLRADPTTLESLIGRPPTSMSQAVAQAYAALAGQGHPTP